MLSIKNLPLWAKSLIAPTVVLLAMLAMAGAAIVHLTQQEAAATNLDRLAFEGVRQALVAIGSVTDFQTELYHISSTAANETDKLKVEAEAARLTTLLNALAPQMDIAVVKVDDSHEAAVVPCGRSALASQAMTGRRVK